MLNSLPDHKFDDFPDIPKFYPTCNKVKHVGMVIQYEKVVILLETGRVEVGGKIVRIEMGKFVCDEK